MRDHYFNMVLIGTHLESLGGSCPASQLGSHFFQDSKLVVSSNWIDNVIIDYTVAVFSLIRISDFRLN